jgi:hypothetical protein
MVHQCSNASPDLSLVESQLFSRSVASSHQLHLPRFDLVLAPYRALLNQESEKPCVFPTINYFSDT